MNGLSFVYRVSFKDRFRMKSMFGNCSELSALVLIGLANKCLKSLVQQPGQKFNSNRFESQINERIKKRRNNYCVNICEHDEMSSTALFYSQTKNKTVHFTSGSKTSFHKKQMFETHQSLVLSSKSPYRSNSNSTVGTFDIKCNRGGASSQTNCTRYPAGRGGGRGAGAQNNEE